MTELGFTHVDPFEDTERYYPSRSVVGISSFTHVDPFEDTERPWSEADVGRGKISFTHVDPFEDTERGAADLAEWRQY